MTDKRCWHLYGPGAPNTPYAGKYTYCWEISKDPMHHRPDLLDPWFGRYAHPLQFVEKETSHPQIEEVKSE